MAKLTRQQATLHRAACDLLSLPRDLDPDERMFVLDNWQESTTGTNTLDGAFFTPAELAVDVSVEVVGTTVIDLCAGIGALASACLYNGPRGRTVVCVERNPRYVEIGRKVVPEATWIHADIFHLPQGLLPEGLDRFDTAVSNPPFGATPRTGNAPGYQGRRFEYHVIAIASRLARRGVFIVPQQSVPFRQSQAEDARVLDDEYQHFTRTTGLSLAPSCGIDTELYRSRWRGVAPRTEVAVADLTRSTLPPTDPTAVLPQLTANATQQPTLPMGAAL